MAPQASATNGTTPSAEQFSGPYNGIFAAIYDPLLWWGEKAGMGDRRRELLADARGSVLELGAGTGLNLDHYPDGLERLVLAEPDEAMAKRLRRRAARAERRAEVVRATAESLPFDDDSFDIVVSTLVLCTVEDQHRSAQEVRRVLRPDGQLLYLEHVRAADDRLARWQDRLHDPWQSFACGCHCNRDTLATLREEGFAVGQPEHARWRRMPPLVKPLVKGSASPG